MLNCVILVSISQSQKKKDHIIDPKTVEEELEFEFAKVSE